MVSQLISSFNEPQNDPVGLRVPHRRVIHMRLRDRSRFLSCLFQPLLHVQIVYVCCIYWRRSGRIECVNECGAIPKPSHRKHTTHLSCYDLFRLIEKEGRNSYLIGNDTTLHSLFIKRQAQT